ncbi:hypothetical protein TNCV_2653291 [Trichonephila clavipes]|nr:hypothetical protein TNCV_2653291 [Trichonephila clavipes]
MVLLPEEVEEKGFLESRSPTFRIDSSRKGHARGPVLRVPTGGRKQKRGLDVCELHFSDDAIRRYTEAYNEKTGEKICVP